MEAQITSVSRRWLAQLRLDLRGLRPIAEVMSFSSALRPVTVGLQRHPEY